MDFLISLLIMICSLLALMGLGRIARMDATGARLLLPVIVAPVFIVLSVPFMLGLITPSIHDGSLYSAIYVILNVPAIYFLGGMTEDFTREVFRFRFRHTTQYESNMIFIGVAALYWVFISLVAGLILDLRVKRRKHS